MKNPVRSRDDLSSVTPTGFDERPDVSSFAETRTKGKKEPKLSALSHASFFSAKRFLLLIGNDGAVLVPPKPGKSSPPLFAEHHDDDRVTLLLKTLAARPRTPVLILADTLAQEFHRDTLPRLNVFDKRKIMHRRLRQHFPEPPLPHSQLTVAIALKSNAALYACLHDDGLIALWMERLATRNNPFLGITSLPLVGASLISKLLPESAKGWGILLTCQHTGGFRQIVTYNGEFVFTRLTPPLSSTTSPNLTVASLAIDLQATLSYLSRHGLSGDMPLLMTAVLPQEMHKAIRTLPAPIQIAAALTPYKAAQRLGLPFSSTPHEPTSDLLFAAFAGQQKKGHPLMLPSVQKEILSTTRVQKAGWRLTATMSFIALAFLGWQSHDLWQLAETNRVAAHHLATLQQTWNKEKAALEPLTEPLGKLRQAAARQRLFTASLLTPWPLLQTVNQEIGTEGRLTHLDWRHSQGEQPSETLRFTLRLTLPNRAAVQEESGRQDVVRRVNQLAQFLRDALPNYTVTVTRYPFLIKPDETVSNTGDIAGADSLPTADFEITRTGS